MERRELLQITLAAAIPPPRFFTPEEWKAVDELTEMIVPADGHSGGARAAGAAAYIDRRLAEDTEDEARRLWREGLRPYLGASTEQRQALLTAASKGEADPKTPAERFFQELKERTVIAYYTSRVGIHDEMEYQGNVPLADFVGE
jgi:hypothetical protein